MYCRNCGKYLDSDSGECNFCGKNIFAGNMYCPSCGCFTIPGDAVCNSCGQNLSEYNLQTEKLNESIDDYDLRSKNNMGYKPADEDYFSRPLKYCRNCGLRIPKDADTCQYCLSKVNTTSNFCPNCGQSTLAVSSSCVYCGEKLICITSQQGETTQKNEPEEEQKSKPSGNNFTSGQQQTSQNRQRASKQQRPPDYGRGTNKQNRSLPEVLDDNKFLVTFLLLIFFGYLGIHRIYTRNIVLGLFMFFTGGFCGIGVLVDFILLLSGSYRDGDGNEVCIKIK